MHKEIFFCCGDPSGDLHASELVKALKSIDSSLIITAVGGQKLKEVCDNFLIDIVEMNLHGYWEPLKQFIKIKKIFNEIITKYLTSTRPAVVVPVDFYGFNIKLCKASHSLGIPVMYYISPQVWATRRNRIKKIKKYINKMLVIFPFEEKIYKDAGVNAAFVGHPLLDSINNSPDQGGLAPAPVIGLFPGSRKQVIEWNLPFMIESAFLIKKKIQDVKIIVVGLSKLKSAYQNIDGIEIVYDKDYNWRKTIDFAISASGTVTLENALLGIPMLVAYKLPSLMYLLVKSIVKVKFISIVNLILGKQVIPEFIQSDAVPQKIADTSLEILTNPGKQNEILSAYKKAIEMLGPSGSYNRTAQIILEGVTNA